VLAIDKFKSKQYTIVGYSVNYSQNTKFRETKVGILAALHSKCTHILFYLFPQQSKRYLQFKEIIRVDMIHSSGALNE